MSARRPWAVVGLPAVAVAVGAGVLLGNVDSHGDRPKATDTSSSVASATTNPVAPVPVSVPPSSSPMPSQVLEPPSVISRCGGAREIRPVAISALHCGTNADILIDGISWLNWSSRGAFGSGTMHTNTCQPSCAAGSYSNQTVRVTLGAMNPYSNVFTRLTVIGDGVVPEVDELPSS